MRRPALPLLLLLAPGLAGAYDAVVLDAAGKPLADAVVYAEPAAGAAPKGRLSAAVDQVNKEFVPRIAVVQAGTAVSFPNKDNIRHNIYSFSPAKTFDLKLYSGTPAAPVVFDKPGVVVLGCKIHDWMVGHLLVVDTPWFGRSDAAGLARLGELPPGDYRLHAWHPAQAAEAPVQQLRIGAGDAGRATFRLQLAPAAATAP
ncbi:hypothetical protein [Chitinimonas koreensis]|uniref:hypothetical protein n=1 Tax=Chitinimonas koreensis TaxID=356302 RepID=UPI000688B3E5|nr:hypothetical protein [Chitinimonas koreensis]QNM97001.1 methylamine utilization protein [Chitinimonas koreensis]